MKQTGRKWAGVIAGLLGCCIGTPLTEARVIPFPDEGASWVIERADYTGKVDDRIVRMEGEYTIRVFHDGRVEIPLGLDGATVTSIDIKKKTDEAHLVPRGTCYALTTHRKGVYTIRVQFASLLHQDSQFEGLTLGIPQATFSTLSLVVPRQDVELRPEDQLFVERADPQIQGGVKLIARLGAQSHVDLRWRTKPATPTETEPVLYGEVHTIVTLEEQLARFLSIVDYRITQGQTKNLRAQLPSTLQVLNVRGAGIEDWRLTDQPDHKILTVTLSSPLKEGGYRLVIESEETLTSDRTDYAVPTIHLDGVKQQRGDVAVARSGNLELSPKITEGISRIDVRELPDALRSSIDSPVLLAFRYHQPAYQLILALTRHQDHPVLSAIAEQGELVTVLSRRGESLTRATYLVRANKKQFLEVRLPVGSQLWSCLVDQSSVKPVQGDADRLLIPLSTASEGEQPIIVELVYFEKRPELVRLGQLKLQGPILDVPTTIANWWLYAPRDVRFLRLAGNLDRQTAPIAFVEEPILQLASDTRRSGLAGGMQVIDGKGRTSKQGYAHAGYASDDQMTDQIEQGKEDSGMFRNNGEALVGQKRAEQPRAIAMEFSEVDEPQQTNRPSGGPASSLSMREKGASDSDEIDAMMTRLSAHLKERGILPLKVRLPQSGRVYRFSRLMTTQEPLQLQATFVHLPMSWLVTAMVSLGMLLIPAGALAGFRFLHG